MRILSAPAALAVTATLSCARAPDAQCDLDHAYATLTTHPFVDLTQTFGPDTPVWSGFGQAKMTPALNAETHEPFTIAKEGFHATTYEMVGQYGTHVDPPAHFSEAGATLDRIPIEQMILPLVVLDATPLLASDPNHAFSADDVRGWEQRHGRVPKGAFVALRTDMSKDWTANPARFKRTPFPAWSLGALRLLLDERGVTAIGHESLDTDTTDKMESESYVLKSGHYQVEAMANLDKVPATGAIVVVTWAKVRDGLGFPARVFAIVPS